MPVVMPVMLPVRISGPVVARGVVLRAGRGALTARTVVARWRALVVGKSDFRWRHLALIAWERIAGLRFRALVSRGNIFRARRHGPVVSDALQIHAQLFHFGEALGRDVVPALALD